MTVKEVTDIPFIQIALPIIITFVVSNWQNGKRLDDLGKRIDDVNRRLDEIVRRLERIELAVNDHGQHIVRLEERTSPLARV